MIFSNKRQREISAFEKTIKESLSNIDKTTPYMLRDDGELLPCGEIHPYIKIYYENDYRLNLKELDSHREFLDWFYDNTIKEDTRKLIEMFESNPTEEVFYKLSDATNQEFCRVRTSNFKYKYGGDNGEIYFRISSKDVNWFDMIWDVVNKFKNQIKFVTIMKDFSTFGKQFDYCCYKGQCFNKMPVYDFLTITGTPEVR